MNWFFIALIGPFLYATTNYFDKYLLDKYFKVGESGAIILFSSLFAFVALPVIYLIDPAVFSLSWTNIVVLTLNGTLNIFCLILYFKSLQDSEVSMVIPFYQTIPIFGFILGYFILGEKIGMMEILACLLIILGTTIISLDLTGEKIRFKKKVVVLMLTASLLYAVNGVVFKMIAVDAGFWSSAFWGFVGKVALGGLIFVLVKSYRYQFLEIFKKNSSTVLSLVSLNEVIFIAAEGVSIYATLLAPIVLVMTVNGFQPFFVFLFGILLTIFFPKIGKEVLEKKVLIQKIVAIAFIIGGTLLLGPNIL